MTRPVRPQPGQCVLVPPKQSHPNDPFRPGQVRATWFNKSTGVFMVVGIYTDIPEPCEKSDGMDGYFVAPWPDLALVVESLPGKQAA